MKHNWVFVGIMDEGECTEFLFRCENTGCTKYASFTYATRGSSPIIFRECMKIINKTETKWDICNANLK